MRSYETLNQKNVMGKAGWNVVQNHFGHKFTRYGAQISVEDEELGRSQRFLSFQLERDIGSVRGQAEEKLQSLGL